LQGIVKDYFEGIHGTPLSLPDKKEGPVEIKKAKENSGRSPLRQTDGTRERMGIRLQKRKPAFHGTSPDHLSASSLAEEADC
jgi:hypothetical protein